jgi:hypothetical protein
VPTRGASWQDPVLSSLLQVVEKDGEATAKKRVMAAATQGGGEQRGRRGMAVVGGER